MITSLANPTVKLAASLHQKKYRDTIGLFLVEGREMIAMALLQGWELAYDFALNETATQEILAKISKKENPQDRIAVFKKKPFEKLPSKIDGVLLGVEEIRDPGNLGTLLRSCHALGLKKLVLIGACCDAYAPETIRASMGSFASVNIIATDAAELGASKLRLIGTDVVQAADYRAVDYQDALIVLGNEQKGLSPALKKRCDAAAHIPMPGGTESLNVAMAATLVLYEAMRAKI